MADVDDRAARPVVVVTSAPERSLDSDTRIRRYLVTMAIRTSCFILMVVVDGWLRWAFLAGAAFLPYVAVVLANSRGAQVGRAGQVTPVTGRVDSSRQVHN